MGSLGRCHVLEEAEPLDKFVKLLDVVMSILCSELITTATINIMAERFNMFYRQMGWLIVSLVQ